MVRYVKNEGRPALGFAVESEESDESSDDEPLSDQPSLATLVWRASSAMGTVIFSMASFVKGFFFEAEEGLAGGAGAGSAATGAGAASGAGAGAGSKTGSSATGAGAGTGSGSLAGGLLGSK